MPTRVAADHWAEAYGSGTAEKASESSQESLPAAIVAVLTDAGKSLRAGEVKALLVGRGLSEERFGTNSNYLYTSLRRLVEAGKVRRRAGKYRIAS